MRKTESKVIGGKTYTCTQLGASQGRAVMVRLARVLGGLSAKDPIVGLLATLNDEDIDYVCKAFAPLSTVELSPGKCPSVVDIFEEHFAGDYTSLFAWLAFCVQVNYGPFLAGLGLKMGELGPQVQANLSSLAQK